jgi:2-haloacid dehalogenase
MNHFDVSEIKALVFDVFGTVVDWRGGVIRDGGELAAAKGLRVDWPAFADAWRAGYQPAMQRARSGEIAWTNVDGLHRVILDGLIPRFGLDALTEAEREQFNRVWHRLDPWPDAVAGLTRLKSRFVVSTLSNGNIALLVNMAKRAGLPWDCVLSAEIMKHYKPDPEVYQSAAALLGIERHELLMVAAHPSDLRGAARAGLRTALVHRPLERGANPAGAPPPDALPDDRFDLVADDFVDLARRLGT